MSGITPGHRQGRTGKTVSVMIKFAIFAVCAALLLPSPALADRCSGDYFFAPNVSGRMKAAANPNNMAKKYYNLGKKESSSFDTGLQKLLDIIIKQPYLNPPVGAELKGTLRSWDIQGCDAPCLGRPVQAVGTLYFLELLRADKGWVGPAIETANTLDIEVNNLERATGTPLFPDNLTDSSGRQILVQMQAEGELDGIPLFKDHGKGLARLVFSRGNRPWSVPLTRREYLLAQIRRMEGEIAAMPAATSSPAADTLRKWRQEKPQRRAESDKLYREMRKQNPALAETIRDGHRKMEAEMEQMYLREAEKESVKGAPEGLQTLLGRRLAEHRRVLAAMPPEEQSAQAIYLRNDDPYGVDLAGTGQTRYGRPLVVINPDYFDKSLPRSAMQLITVQSGILFFEEQLPEDSCLLVNPGSILLRKTLRETPWGKFREQLAK
jgi:hypothetical protein